MSQPLTNLGLYGNFTICDNNIISGLNANFQLLDNLVQLAFNGIVAELPEDPVEGDKYILSTDNSINLWNGTEWIMYPAQEGYIGYNKGDGLIYFFDGDEWIPIPADTISFDNTGTSLIATNVQDAILELIAMVEGLPVSGIDNVGTGAEIFKDITSGTANLRSIIVQSPLSVVQNTNDITLSLLLDQLFPVGQLGVSLHEDFPPNAAVNWLDITSADLTISLTTNPEYTNLFNFLKTNGFFDIGIPSAIAMFRETVVDDTFVIRKMAGLGIAGVGNSSSSLFFARSKSGPIGHGAVQEDQMQRITGSFKGTDDNTIAYNLRWKDATGAFTALDDNTNYISTQNTSVTNLPGNMKFNSANSPDARASSTTDGETRGSNLGVYYWIRY